MHGRDNCCSSLKIGKNFDSKIPQPLFFPSFPQGIRHYLCYPSPVANPEHLSRIQEGVAAWNAWRNDFPGLEPDLSDADLRQMDLRAADLRRSKLIGTNLAHADLRRTQLYEVEMSRADLQEADLRGAKLRKANLTKANLSGALLSTAKLRQADLSTTILREANLNGADMREADLYLSDMRGAVLLGTDLRSANLQKSNLDRALLSNARFWESQRAGWSIKEVICTCAYWDKEAKKAAQYSRGEFEQLYSDQTCIELFYDGSISIFELSTLPALLHHLSSKHPNTKIRLKTIEETGGGAKITISLDDADERTKAKIEADATHAHQIQLALRGREDELIDLRASLRATERAYDKLLDKMSDSRKQEITIHGNLQGPLQLGDHTSADFRGVQFNDPTLVIQLLDKLLTHSSDLNLSSTKDQALTENAEAVKAELQKKDPNKSILKRSLDFFATLPKEALVKGAGKLGEKAVEANWSDLIHQLGQFLHHLG
ncbi:MAG TPA: pentapeptide repeat-containing protein [Acidobacteriaceae bacterium]|nr:pentapeptide repeat-containing protein [Acidobacteriaceae bacterium]